MEGWEHLKAFGYAPGDYVMTCKGCGERAWHVDKRASRCRPCAEKAYQDHQQFMPVGENANGDGI